MFELLFSVFVTASPLQGADFEAEFQQDSFNLSVSPIPVVSEQMDEVLSAKSYLAIDTESNIRLFEKNSDEQLPVASLTKIMTALIILENHELNEIVLVSKETVYESKESRMWLQANERMTVGNLLKGLLVKSGNDAAIALAKYHSGSLDGFVKEMNRRSRDLRMNNTHFKNPHGLDQDGHYSSANDLMILVQAAWRHQRFREIVNMKEAKIYSLDNPDREFTNTNRLLGGEIKGVKTGTTLLAGECLLLYVEKEGHHFFTVVLGSNKRFDDSQKFINNMWEKIQW